MLNYEFPPIGGGGGNAHLYLLKEYADREQIVIDVLTSAACPGFFEEKFADNITIFKVGVHKKSLHYWRKIEVIEWLFKAGRKYKKMLQDNSYDLVHAFFGFPTGWFCYRTAGKLPYIISLRGSDVPGRHARLQIDYKILAPIFKTIWEKAACLVACSEGLKDRALKFLPSVSIDVIPNGVDRQKFYPPAPPAERKRTETLKLLTVGRLSATKRVDMLIEAVGLLRSEGRNIRLLIAGGGSLEQELKQIIEKQELADLIEITGRIDAEKMPEIYRNSDIFVSATMQEGMSNAMLEAMACGLPIITTPCEGLEELINENGIIVKQANSTAIAEAVKSLADDEKLYNKMSAAAAEQAEKFTWQNVAKKYIDIYHRIAAR